MHASSTDEAPVETKPDPENEKRQEQGVNVAIGVIMFFLFVMFGLAPFAKMRMDMERDSQTYLRAYANEFHQGFFPLRKDGTIAPGFAKDADGYCRILPNGTREKLRRTRIGYHIQLAGDPQDVEKEVASCEMLATKQIHALLNKPERLYWDVEKAGNN